MSVARKKNYQNLYVGLTSGEHKRLEALSQIDGKSKSELGREALQWYLDQRENEQSADRESVYAKSLKEMTNRICGMLARQGTALGVLYDLAWHSMRDEEERRFFDNVVKEVKSRTRRHLDNDEKKLSERMIAIAKGLKTTTGE